MIIKGEEIKQKYPKAFQLLYKRWFGVGEECMGDEEAFIKLLNTIPDNINGSVRYVQFFDEQQLYIVADCEPDGSKWYSILSGIQIEETTSRYEAECIGIEFAFETLEQITE